MGGFRRKRGREVQSYTRRTRSKKQGGSRTAHDKEIQVEKGGI